LVDAVEALLRLVDDAALVAADGKAEPALHEACAVVSEARPISTAAVV
jgi:hypothetical protein